MTKRKIKFLNAIIYVVFTNHNKINYNIKTSYYSLILYIIDNLILHPELDYYLFLHYDIYLIGS